MIKYLGYLPRKLNLFSHLFLFLFLFVYFILYIYLAFFIIKNCFSKDIMHASRKHDYWRKKQLIQLFSMKIFTIITLIEMKNVN